MKKFIPIVSISILALAIAKAQDPAKAQRRSTITHYYPATFEDLAIGWWFATDRFPGPRTRSADSIGVAVRLDRKSTSDVV